LSEWAAEVRAFSEPAPRATAFAEAPDLAAARWHPAGPDGKRAFELLAEARSQVAGTFVGLTERAVGRLLGSGKPLTAQELYSDEELGELQEALARLIALGDLMGRARVRLMADRLDRTAPRPLTRFAEWAGPFDGERGGKYWLPRGAPDRPENRRYDAPEAGTPPEGVNEPEGPKERAGIAEGRRAALEELAAKIPVTRTLISEYDEDEPPYGIWGQDDNTFPVLWFKTSTGSKYKIEVVPTDEPLKSAELIFSDEKNKIGVTGAGAAHEVFTNVLAASVALLRAKKPRVVSFSAAGEGAAGDARATGRQRLYERLARGIAAMNGEYVAVSFPGADPSEPTVYVVAQRDRLQSVLDTVRRQTGQQGKVLVFADAPPELWAAGADWGARWVAFADADGDGIDDLFSPLTQARIQPLPPRAAVDYFRGLVPSLGASPVRYGPRLDRYAFTLAAAADQTVLQRVQTAILNALQQGGDAGASAVPDVQAILDAAGVSGRNPQYAEMVVRTNLNDAYNQGAEAELGEGDMRERFPVWQYLGILDDRTGDDHRPKIGRYYPSTATFQEVRGNRVYNCRCSFAPVSRFLADNLTVETEW